MSGRIGTPPEERPALVVCAACRAQFDAGGKGTGDTVACALCGAVVVLGACSVERRRIGDDEARAAARRQRARARLGRERRARALRAAGLLALLLLLVAGAVMWQVPLIEFLRLVFGAAGEAGR